MWRAGLIRLQGHHRSMQPKPPHAVSFPRLFARQVARAARGNRRRMDPLRFASRMEDVLGWFAASVLTATMVIYALRRGERTTRPKLALVDPSPAQEPLELQLARAAERGRGRKATTPAHVPWQ